VHHTHTHTAQHSTTPLWHMEQACVWWSARIYQGTKYLRSLST
jgi:hypothetical protein